MAPNRNFDDTMFLVGQSLVGIKRFYPDEGLSLEYSFGMLSPPLKVLLKKQFFNVSSFILRSFLKLF